jgi:dihydrofolate synthase/folylpolyglutamate synthase
MNYQETLKFLYSQLPMYQREGATAYKKDLTNSIKLSEHDGYPHKKFKSIHIAGTNGKGSVSHMLSSVLQDSGCKVGLYTSPHLKDFRERIKINGKMIPEEEVIKYVEKNKLFFEELKPSFFEMTVALAFQYFAKESVEIAIIETGLGGRLDSTNILTPVLSIITNISFDHTQLLGDTLEKIAFEKAGIIKPGIPVIIGESDKTTQSVFINRAKTLSSPIYFADKELQIDYSLISTDYKQIFNVERNQKAEYTNLISDLTGLYQKKNLITSLKAIDILKSEFLITDENIYSGILNVKKNTNFAGRWHILGFNPLIVADTGHNIAGIKEILIQLNATAYKRLHFIYGTVNDKDIDEILNVLPKDAEYYFTQANIPRALDAEILFKKAKQFNLSGKMYKDTQSAYKDALNNSEINDLILIGGSTFIVAELM